MIYGRRTRTRNRCRSTSLAQCLSDDLSSGRAVLVLDASLLELLGGVGGGVLLLGKLCLSIGGAVDLLVLGSRLLSGVLGSGISTFRLGSLELLNLLLGLLDVLQACQWLITMAVIVLELTSWVLRCWSFFQKSSFSLSFSTTDGTSAWLAGESTLS